LQKSPTKETYILQRDIFLSILLIVATPYQITLVLLVSKTAPYLSERAPYFSKRDLQKRPIFCKETYYILYRAPYLSKKAPYFRKRATYLSARKPYISEKGLNILPKELNTFKNATG